MFQVQGQVQVQVCTLQLGQVQATLRRRDLGVSSRPSPGSVFRATVCKWTGQFRSRRIPQV